MTKYTTTIRGREHEWRVEISEASVADMRADGIEVFEVANTFPNWVLVIGLAEPWCMAQDLFDWPSRIWRKLRGKP